MSGGSGTPSKTTQTQEPPKYLQEPLSRAAAGASSLYQRGMPAYYPGETVVPFSQETQNALSGITDRAMAGSHLTGAANRFATDALSGGQSSIFGGGSNPFATGANPFGDARNPFTEPGGLGYSQNPFASGGNIYGNASNPYAGTLNEFGASANPINSAANPFGSASNPALDATFNRAADSVQQRLASQFAGSGRNIGASRAVNADELNNLATNIYGGAYESERNRQMGYQQQLNALQSGAYEDERNRMLQRGQQITGIGADAYESERNRMLQRDTQLSGLGSDAYENERSRQLQYAGMGANAYENERARQAQYAGQQLGIGAQGYESERNRMADDLKAQSAQRLGILGMTPQLAGQDYADFDRLAQVGATREDLTGRQMEDAAARYDYDVNAPQMNLDRYIARLGGLLGGSGGTVTSTTPTYRNRAGSAVGGGLLGYSIGSGVGAAGGAAAGAAGGAAGGAATGSMAGPWGALIGAGLGYLMG